MTTGRAVLEGGLILAVLSPVAVHPAVRRTFRRLDRPRRAALATMLALALAGQLALDTALFPFVHWHMYATTPRGDPTVYEYDAVLRSGSRVPLVPGRFLGPESADRMMEALRRQVDRVKLGGVDPATAAARREHAQALGAIARRSDEDHPRDPVAAVVVSQRTVSIRSGEKRPPRALWRVELP